MSSLLISRIILGAFLAVSLSACSKDSKGSKASVRNKGGGQTGAQKPGAPMLDADAAKAAAAKENGDAKPADATQPEEKNSEVISDDSAPAETPVAGGSSIIVKPIAPKLATTAAKPVAQAAVTPSPVTVKPAVVKPAPAAKPEAQVETKPAALPAKPAPVVLKAPVAPVKAPITPAQQEVKPAPVLKPVLKPEVKAETKSEVKPDAKIEAKPVVKAVAKPEIKKAAPVAKTAVAQVEKPAAKPTSKTKKAVAKSNAPSAADKATETKRLSEEQSQSEVAREAARRTLVVKAPEDLDKDDTTKENIGPAAYRTLVADLLAKIDMKLATVASKVADGNYFSFDTRPVRQVPAVVYDTLMSSKACDSENSSGCLMVEVSKKNTVVLSYVGTQTKYNEATKRTETLIYRNDVANVDAATQAQIEQLSRIAGGKTVVFTTVKTTEPAVSPAAEAPKK